MRVDRAIEERIIAATEQFRIATVTAVVGNQITVAMPGGGTPTIPRLSTWNVLVGDIVLIAVTPAGWVALGAIA
jgi:hypothetical protein